MKGMAQAVLADAVGDPRPSGQALDGAVGGVARPSARLWPQEDRAGGPLVEVVEVEHSGDGTWSLASRVPLALEANVRYSNAR